MNIARCANTKSVSYLQLVKAINVKYVGPVCFINNLVLNCVLLIFPSSDALLRQYSFESPLIFPAEQRQGPDRGKFLLKIPLGICVRDPLLCCFKISLLQPAVVVTKSKIYDLSVYFFIILVY